MSVSGVNGVNGASVISTGSTSTGATTSLGKQDFLMLLVAQLKNQDPLKPMDDTAFIAQLAQFSSLEQLQQMNQQLSAANGLAALGELASLIGKEVTAVDPTTNSPFTGLVSEVQLINGTPRLMVGGKSIDPANILAIAAQPVTPSAAAGGAGIGQAGNSGSTASADAEHSSETTPNAA